MYRTIFIRFKYICSFFFRIRYFLCYIITICIFDFEFYSSCRNAFSSFTVRFVDS